MIFASSSSCVIESSRLKAITGGEGSYEINPDTVRAGAPAYLLLLDSLIEASPNDTGILIAGANLYGAYTSGLIEDPLRGKRLSSRALNYARTALCGEEPNICRL
ncbi:MAG: TRAP transporter TatT component family protein, partial [Sedimenticola sp.]